MWNKKRQPSGFTIVELLIVIVVIGILAAITIVAYSGVQNRANDVAVQNDLSAIGKKILLYHADFATYPSISILDSLDLSASQNSYGAHYTNTSGDWNLIYCMNATSFGLAAASKSGKVYKFVPSQGNVTEHSSALSGSSSLCPQIGVSSYTSRWAYTASAWTSMTN